MVTTPLDRSERLHIFLDRLKTAEPAADFEEAFSQIAAILNAVEDEFSGIPFDPDNWMSDGRLYPPKIDSERDVANRPGWRRFRTKGHNVLVSELGSIEIYDLSGELVLRKSGHSEL